MKKQLFLLLFSLGLLWGCGSEQANNPETEDPVLKETILKEEAAAETIDSIKQDIENTSAELEGLLEDLN